MENFSTITNKIMSHNHWSEQQLADVIGISQPALHRIKTGATNAPYYYTGVKLMKLYEAIEVSA